MTERFDTIVVGGGQGGLCVSHFLAQQGDDHVVLERADKPADARRNHRWDSFFLNKRIVNDEPAAVVPRALTVPELDETPWVSHDLCCA